MFRVFWALLLIKYRSATTEKYVFYGFSRRFLIGTPGLLSDSRVVLVPVHPELEAVLSTTGSMATFRFGQIMFMSVHQPPHLQRDEYL